MYSIINSFTTRIRDFIIRNEAVLLLLTLFNCAILMNFHDLFWSRKIMVGGLLLSVIVSFINFRLWIAVLGSICISFIYFIERFPRLANHGNIEFFVEIGILTLLLCRFFDSKLKIRPGLIGYLFRVSVVSIYFYTGFNKLNTDFFNPCVSCVNEISDYILGNFIGNKISISDNLSLLFQYLAIIMEMIVPFGLLFYQTRKGTAILLLLFHFYLNFAVYADFSALAVFLILGSILDFESKKVHRKIIQSLKYYIGFTLLAFIIRQLLIKYNMNPYYYGFIEGSVLNIGWIIFFYTFFKNYESKIYQYEKKYTLPISICFILISFWTLRAYVGLGNSGNLTMFSNLNTEKERSNHLLINTKYTKIVDFEEDAVLILKLHDTLKKHKLENFRIPISEFRFLSNHWSKRYKIKLNCILVYKNDTIKIDDLKNSSFVETKWWYKYLYFRKIQPNGPNECLW
jgi:hypothetical protein